MVHTFSKNVIHLTPEDFNEVESWKLDKNKCCFVLFYVEWCKWCQSVIPEWNKLADVMGFFDVAAFDCQKYSSHVDKIKTDVDGMIEGFPTLIIYSNGKPVHKYEDERTVGKMFETCMDVCKLK